MTDLGSHIPVMKAEVMKAFEEQNKTPERILDGTFGRGGHTRALLNSFPKAKVFSFDRDEDAIMFGKKEFAPEILNKRLELFHDDFRVLEKYKLGKFDGALFDLGVSSPQFNNADRGFSFQNDGPLDMRMSRSQQTTAAEIVNESSEKELSDIFYHLGEVRHPNRIVRAIVHDRKTTPFTTTKQLAGLIERVEKRSSKKIHAATPYFMALRIAVNKELDGLDEFIGTMPRFLEPGGRMVMISFHSLEDRIVKWAFRRLDKIEGHIVTKKVLTPSDEEVEKNPRSRSAKLRIFEKGETA